MQINNNNQTRVEAAGVTGSGGAKAGKERTQGTLCDLQITRCSDRISSTLLETCKPKTAPQPQLHTTPPGQKEKSPPKKGSDQCNIFVKN